MPKIDDIDVSSEHSDSDSEGEGEGGDIPHRTEADVKSKAQLNRELHDDVERAADDAGDADEGDVNAADEGHQEEAVAPDADHHEDEDEGEEPQEDEFVVEAIVDHTIRGKKVTYLIKWVGYPDDQNTWEPEENLLPHARNLLAAYHKKIGGAPQANKPLKKSKSTQSLRGRQSSSADASPAPKRRKQNNGSAAADDDDDVHGVGTWTPGREDWEPQVVRVATVEKSESGQLMAYIEFRNGRKTKVSMDQVYRHCPRPMLKFYEEHLKFNV